MYVFVRDLFTELFDPAQSLLFIGNYSGALFWLLTAYGRSQALGCGVWIWQPEAAKSILHTKEASHRRW